MLSEKVSNLFFWISNKDYNLLNKKDLIISFISNELRIPAEFNVKTWSIKALN